MAPMRASAREFLPSAITAERGKALSSLLTP